MTGEVQGNVGRGRDEWDNWTAAGISGRLVDYTQTENVRHFEQRTSDLCIVLFSELRPYAREKCM